MTDSFQGGTFDPIESEDYVAPLQTGYKQINQGMNNYWNQELSSYNQAAKVAGKNLEALADMSSTISGVLAQKEAEKREVDFAKGHLWFEENGVPELEMAALDAAEGELDAEGLEINKLRFAAEEKGASIWESLEFKKLNKAEQKGAVVAFIQNRAQAYDPSNHPDLKNATSYEEYKSAEQKHKLAFYKTLGDINPALVYKYANQTVRSKDSSAYNAWNTKRTGEIQAQEKLDAQKSFELCVKGSVDGVNCMMDHTKKYQHLFGGTPGQARVSFLNHAKTLAENGVLSPEQVNTMLKQTFVHKGTGKEESYESAFELEANQIRDAHASYERKKLQQKDILKTALANEEFEEWNAQFDPEKLAEEGYNEKAVEEAIKIQREQQIKYEGYSHPMWNKIITDLSAKQIDLDEEQAKFDKDFEMGLVDQKRFDELPYQLQTKANKQKLIDSQTYLGNAEKFDKDFEDLVRKEAKIVPGGYDDGANQLTRYFQAEWRSRAAEIASSLPPEQKHLAGQMAYDEIKLKFETEIGKGLTNNPYQDDKGNFISPSAYTDQEVAENSKAIDAVISKENSYIKQMGYAALESPRLFFSEQELIDIQNNAATQGRLVIPEKAKRIAKQFDGLNAIEVINLQRQSLGMDPITSNSFELYDGLSTENKFLLNYSATSMTSARAWGSVNYDDIGITGKDGERLGVVGVGALRPDGEQITEVAEATNMDVRYVQAGVEFAEELGQEGVTIDPTKPIYPQLSKDQKRAYMRFRYKYGDKEALKELVHDGIELNE